jgi:hypothetical protein
MDCRGADLFAKFDGSSQDRQQHGLLSLVQLIDQRLRDDCANFLRTTTHRFSPTLLRRGWPALLASRAPMRERELPAWLRASPQAFDRRTATATETATR